MNEKGGVEMLSLPDAWAPLHLFRAPPPNCPIWLDVFRGPGHAQHGDQPERQRKQATASQKSKTKNPDYEKMATAGGSINGKIKWYMYVRA